MLTPEQIEALRDAFGAIADPINDYLVEDIARRVSEAGQLTSTAAYQVWRAQQLDVSQREMKKRLRKLLGVSHKEVRRLLTQAAEVGYDFDIKHLPYVQALPFENNPVMQQITQAAVNLALEDFTNLTQTIGMVDPYGNALPLQKAYRSCTDFAFKQVITGATDYNTAIRRATANLADKGVQWIDYESGVHTSLEAAIRRNMMGGLGLIQEQTTQQNHDALGANGWEISAHAASAPDHEPIQGKQYTDAEYERLNGSLQRRIGTLNCGHAAFPIILGVSAPQYTPEQLKKFREDNVAGVDYQGRHYSMYDATQKQRQVERTIRRQKRRIVDAEGRGNADDKLTAQIRLTRLNDEYARFSKEAGLRTQRERAQIAGFSAKQAGEARGASIVPEKVVRFDATHKTNIDSELLPAHSQAAIPQEKLTGYALNLNHPTGKNKAIAFERALGYTVDNWEQLERQVQSGLTVYRATARQATKYGQPYEVTMMIRGVNGKYAKVKTGWIIDGGAGAPRLTSIYVDD